VLKKVKEADGKPVRIRNEATKKEYNVAVKRLHPTEPIQCNDRVVAIQTDPSLKNPKGTTRLVPMGNLVFVETEDE